MSGCGCEKKNDKEVCCPEEVKKECPPEKKAEKCGSGLLSFLKCGASKGDEKCPPVCPPMPCFDTSDCKPDWVRNPPSPTTKTYPAPEGVEILPISVGGRYGAPNKACGAPQKCGSCGSMPEKPKKCGKPKVANKECPMMQPRCPGDKGKEDEEGFLNKFKSLFGKKEKSELEIICDKLKVENEQIRHHRDVVKPTLVFRRDGYLCPLMAECSGKRCAPEPNCCPSDTQPKQPTCSEPCGYYNRQTNEYVYEPVPLGFGFSSTDTNCKSKAEQCEPVTEDCGQCGECDLCGFGGTVPIVTQDCQECDCDCEDCGDMPIQDDYCCDCAADEVVCECCECQEEQVTSDPECEEKVSLEQENFDLEVEDCDGPVYDFDPECDPDCQEYEEPIIKFDPECEDKIILDPEPEESCDEQVPLVLETEPSCEAEPPTPVVDPECADKEPIVEPEPSCDPPKPVAKPCCPAAPKPKECCPAAAPKPKECCPAAPKPKECCAEIPAGCCESKGLVKPKEKVIRCYCVEVEKEPEPECPAKPKAEEVADCLGLEKIPDPCDERPVPEPCCEKVPDACNNKPEPKPCCEPVPKPKPCCEPVPKPNPCCEPAPQPRPCCEPVPEPKPCCEPVPTPTPCCEPAPQPKPCCEPIPEPKPCCEPVPEPKPCCEPAKPVLLPLPESCRSTPKSPSAPKPAPAPVQEEPPSAKSDPWNYEPSEPEPEPCEPYEPREFEILPFLTDATGTELEPPPSLIPEVDRIMSSEEASKMANRMLETSCPCGACNPGGGCVRSRPVTCGICGEERGLNTACEMCRFSNCMAAQRACMNVEEECDNRDRCDSDVFDLDENGKPIYEGGMCITRAQYYLWKASDDGPEGNSIRAMSFVGREFTGFGSKPKDGDLECTCEKHKQMEEERARRNKYRGGMDLEEAQKYLWCTSAPLK